MLSTSICEAGEVELRLVLRTAYMANSVYASYAQTVGWFIHHHPLPAYRVPTWSVEFWASASASVNQQQIRLGGRHMAVLMVLRMPLFVGDIARVSVDRCGSS